jgi:molybdopterin synthase catalytic subunit
MRLFGFSHSAIDPRSLRVQLEDPAAGGYASFEGWVRNHNEGQEVTRLEYEAFETLAVKEGERIVREAIERYDGSASAHAIAPKHSPRADTSSTK